MRNQKGFVKTQILVPIVAGILVMGGFGYLEVRRYENNQTQKIKEGEIAKQDQEQRKIEEQARDVEIEKLKNEIEILKNKKQQVIIKEIPKSGQDLSTIISQWRPKVAYISCYFGTEMTQSGAGLIVGSSNNFSVVTNRHIVQTLIGTNTYRANYCSVTLPGDTSSATSDTFYVNQGSKEYQDVARLIIVNPTPYMKKIIDTRDVFVCWGPLGIGNSQIPQIGDSVVILGYPGIGSQTDVTATEGIISGIDFPYYITSAKIDHGNSGGVAVLVKSNCDIGIPTFVLGGELESLGRILDWNTAMKSDVTPLDILIK